MATMSDQFREVVRRLGSSAQKQESYLQQLGTAPSADELALEYSDALDVVRDELDDPARSATAQLDRYLEEISGSENVELWTVAALHSAPEWKRVRQLAAAVLRALKESGGSG